MSARLELPGLELVERLGEGGMGEVWLARRERAGGFRQLVAVKLVAEALLGRDDARAMFLDEARLLASLTHPAIAQVHDFGEAEGRLYLVMELVRGVSLARVLEACGPMPAGVAARAIAAAARGLHAAHELTDASGARLGVVHRDLSPDNVLLTFDGHVKVIDFGIAYSHARSVPKTQDGGLRGKYPYLAPEQVLGQAADHRVDLHALGAVLYELVEGRPAFTGEALAPLLEAVAHRTPTFGPRWEGAEGLEAITRRCLEKAPSARLESARALAEALEEFAARASAPGLETFVETHLGEARARVERRLARALGERPRSARRTEIDAESPRPPEDGAPGPAGGASTAPPAPRRATAGYVALSGAMAALVVGLALRGRAPESAPLIVGTPADPAERDLRVERPTDTSTRPTEPTITQELTQPIRPAEPTQPTNPPTLAAPPRPARPRSVDPGAPARGAPDVLEPARLEVGAHPYGLVRLDGRELGVTPVLDLAVPAGRHRLEVLAPDDGHVRHAEWLELAPGERRAVRVR